MALALVRLLTFHPSPTVHLASGSASHRASWVPSRSRTASPKTVGAEGLETRADLLGQSVSFRAPDSRGALTAVPSPENRATVLDFWAPDCAPCARSLPKLVAKTEDLKERGIRLVLVRVLLEGESTDQAKGVLRSWGVYRDFVVDRNGAVQKQLNLGKLPATVVVDRQARLKWVAPGDATAEDVEAAARVVAKEGP